MADCWVDDLKYSPDCTPSSRSDPHPSSLRPRNVFQLLSLREISPYSKNSAKKSNTGTDGYGPRCEIIDARKSLISWVEADSLRNLSAKYCPLLPPPRSTIAATFTSDGEKLASTHGDHTVKIIDCQSGSCLKVLSGHRRTPWVVRFHPLHSEILASGSLDHEVRLWDANAAACIQSHDFYRPVASLAFHAQGEIIAVASGHKLFMWHYSNRRGETSSPISVLKTTRSLRAVHFHPYAAPLLLTAEVNDLDSPDYQLTPATTAGYPQYPPAIVFTNLKDRTHADDGDRMHFMPPHFSWPAFITDGGKHLQQRSTVTDAVNGQRRDGFSQQQQQTSSNIGSQHNRQVMPVEANLGPSASNFATDIAVGNSLIAGMEVATGYRGNENLTNIIGRHTFMSPNAASAGVESTAFSSSNISDNRQSGMPMRSAGDGNFHIPFGDLASWQLPFLQGWAMGQSQTHAGLHMMPPVNRALQGSAPPGLGSEFLHNVGTVPASSARAIPFNPRDAGRNSSRQRSSSRLMVSTYQGEDAAELPCTVKLRIWSYDIGVPCAPLDPERCLLMIPHAVLCSEMGAHFSPCGRFLAACVACILPQLEGNHGFQPHTFADSLDQPHTLVDSLESATSPTRHPLSAQQVIYELRVYSLEKNTFGVVLASKAIRAAHCLTSIQFSPTSEHLLLAYGRRHDSLRWRRAIDADPAIHAFTIMEVYRVSDMELVRVLPSVDDEVNVACFHPSAGGGLVYGTKEGKLRIFQYDGPRGTNCLTSNSLIQEDMIEMVQQYALEC